MKNMFVIFLLFASISTYSQSNEIGISEYLDQVRSNQPGYRGAETLSDAAAKKKDEATLPYSIYMFGEAKHLDDRSPRTSTLLMGNRQTQDAYSFGFSKQTRYGLTSKLYYNSGYFETFGLQSFGSTSFGLPYYYNNSLNLELSQSLLKNGFGRANRATEEAAVARQESNHRTQKFNSISLIAEAETLYWSLALSQEIVKVQKDGLVRAEEIVKHNETRLRQNLLETSDVIQAKAALESRRLSYQSAENNLAEAAIAFNLARGVTDTVVPETLKVPQTKYISELRLPLKTSMRLDALAAKYATDAAKATAVVGEENTKPDLEIFGKVSSGGLNRKFSEASSDSFSNQYPTTQVGVRFNIPLDREAVKNTQAGYRLDALGAELNYKSKLQNQEMLWRNLNRSFDERKNRLITAEKAENLQLEKLKNEKRIRSAGRSTTYQVLLFEQDYLASQVVRLQLMQEALQIYAQMKTFEGDK